MLYFPQLLSGATAQYPFSKLRIARTVLALKPDGSSSKLPDPSAALVEWRLGFTGLTTAERLALESFFEAAEGRLQEFTFLDPTDNLLIRSEELTAAAWVKDPMLALSEGVPDPAGTNRATRITNSGAAVQTIQQTIGTPSWFQHCFSFYARSGQTASLGVFRSAGAAVRSETIQVGTAWARYTQGGALTSNAEQLSFGINLEPGAAVEVFGLQVEAQPGASAYRKTITRSGVYTKVRFAEDSLKVTSEGPDEHDCPVRITAKLDS